MKAAIFRGAQSMEVNKVAPLACGDHDIILRVRSCGICGSDLHSMRTGDFVSEGQIMGHEFVGEVTETGSNVKGIQSGDRVVGSSAVFCGECQWCQTGDFIYCPELFHTAIGYGRPGGFSEYVRIENALLDQTVFHVPENLLDEEAALMEPLGVAALTVSKVHRASFKRAVILGGGIIGNLTAQLLKNVYNYEVVVSEPSELRRNKAHGVDHTINPFEQDLIPFLQELWGEGKYHFGSGGLADLVIDCAGGRQTFIQSLEAVRSKGIIGVVALPDQPVPVNLMRVVHKAPEIIGVLGSDMGAAVQYASEGKVNLNALVSHSYDLEDIEEAFKIQQKAEDSVKVVVKP
ncbi:zinc-dependent alcohol dehydrogenase [Halobacillus sp. B23F22_1]|uniref:zinc-dependent alcohol dehydrogenase n=1 Tax=Halobacillus sp. B23F22_1 TaxID=3459514 RepID=UPI00373E916E